MSASLQFDLRPPLAPSCTARANIPPAAAAVANASKGKDLRASSAPSESRPATKEKRTVTAVARVLSRAPMATDSLPAGGRDLRLLRVWCPLAASRSSRVCASRVCSRLQSQTANRMAIPTGTARSMMMAPTIRICRALIRERACPAGRSAPANLRYSIRPPAAYAYTARPAPAATSSTTPRS